MILHDLSLHIHRVKNNCWPLAVFRAKLPNGQPFLKVFGRLGQPEAHVGLLANCDPSVTKFSLVLGEIQCDIEPESLNFHYA